MIVPIRDGGLRRGETFVTRKTTRGRATITVGSDKCQYMGNLDPLRDFGHAKDFVRMLGMLRQREQAKGYVVPMGGPCSVRLFIDMSAKDLGITLMFEGRGLDGRAVVRPVEGDEAPVVKEGDVNAQRRKTR